MNFDLYAPIEQARRCLDLWLAEEGRDMDEKRRQRASALMARYFMHEEQATDQLMLSFLRHYSGHREVDIDDMASVKMEIKALLDQSVPASPPTARRVSVAFAVGLVLALALAGGWQASQRKITQEQQAELRGIVDDIVAAQEGVTHAAVWTRVKKPLAVDRYQDISWWDFDESREMLMKIRAGER